MNEKLPILVEPGNPFGFDTSEFDELLTALREGHGSDYDIRVAYREQVGAAVTLHEVVNYWLLIKDWFPWKETAALLAADLIRDTKRWFRERHNKRPDIPTRPVSINIYAINNAGDIYLIQEAKIENPDAEPEYGPSPIEEARGDLPKQPPPQRPWPPREEDRSQRSKQERTNRRIMLEAVHEMVSETQQGGKETLVLNAAGVADIGKHMQLNVAQSKGLFKRLVEEGYVRLRGSLDHEAPGELRAEVEYLTDRGLQEIGEI